MTAALSVDVDPYEAIDAAGDDVDLPELDAAATRAGSTAVEYVSQDGIRCRVDVTPHARDGRKFVRLWGRDSHGAPFVVVLMPGSAALLRQALAGALSQLDTMSPARPHDGPTYRPGVPRGHVTPPLKRTT